MAAKNNEPPTKQQQIDVRREKVKKFMVRRVSTTRMATELGVSKRCIEMDIASIRRSEELRLDKMTAGEFLSECKLRAGEVEREAWIIFHDEHSTAGEKLAALNTIKGIARDDLAIMQALGAVPPSQIGATVNVSAQVIQMTPAYVARWVMAALAPEDEAVKERVIARLKQPHLLVDESMPALKSISAKEE
jgi:hypothetical protein